MLSPNDYQKLASRTLIARPDREYTDLEIMLVWNALGVAGEAGEYADSVKKMIFHNHPVDIQKLASELGDLLWYVAASASKLGLDLETIMQGNLDKLARRYPDGYSSAASRARVDVSTEYPMKQRSVDLDNVTPAQPYYRAGRPRPDAEPAPVAGGVGLSPEAADRARGILASWPDAEAIERRAQLAGIVPPVEMRQPDAPPLDPNAGGDDTDAFWQDRLARWPAAALAGSSAAAGFLRPALQAALAAEVEEMRQAQLARTVPANPYADILALAIALDIPASELARKLTIQPASAEAAQPEAKPDIEARIDEATRAALEAEAIRQKQHAHGMYLKLRAGGWNPDTGELSVPATAGASVDAPAVDQDSDQPDYPAAGARWESYDLASQDRPADGPDQASEQPASPLAALAEAMRNRQTVSDGLSLKLRTAADAPAAGLSAGLAAGTISAEPAARAEPMTAAQLADDDLSRELSGFKPPMFGPRGLASRIAESVRKESEARQKLAGGQATDGRTTDDDH